MKEAPDRNMRAPVMTEVARNEKNSKACKENQSR